MKLMKTLMLCCVLFTFTACSDQLDETEAKAVVENLLQEIDNENYESLAEFYSNSFNDGESIEKRAEKFDKLKSILGGLMAFEVIETENLANFGEPAQVLLTYRIQRTKVSSIEKFVVIKESGAYRVTSHGITNE
ncbi:MAG: hypothetical protein H0X62_02170 [Bacteroidetes bacterium]|nr:hypothetical protein [Bacteroidota bacterium]